MPHDGKVLEKHGKRSRLTGSHMKAATDAINKLVDESIVNRVEEAEKEVSQMLLRNIEHHIQDAGKIFKSPDDKTTLSAECERNVATRATIAMSCWIAVCKQSWPRNWKITPM